jgi:hypothetical protein
MKIADIHDYNQFYKGFYIIENIIDLFDFFNEKHYGMTKEIARELVDRVQLSEKNQKVPDPTNKYIEQIEEIQKIHGHGIIYTECLIMGEYQTNLIDCINKNRIIAINPYNGISFFTLSNNGTYTVTGNIEYTKDDIRVLRFPDGHHWYAKLGKMDVVIDGEQKWNARWVAQQKAEQFLEEKTWINKK